MGATCGCPGKEHSHDHGPARLVKLESLARHVIRRIVLARGTVQGVGFRPLVYRRAVGLGLSGTVANTPEGVRVDVEGSPEAVSTFIAGLGRDLPPLARIAALDVGEAPPRGAAGFSIVESETAGAHAALPPPDSAPCAECLCDLRDPAGRRRGYAFVNCTACGPRLSIVRALPYDRARTTMAVFALCEDCRREYEDPSSRRFHAEPNACARCGPRLTFDAAPFACDAALSLAIAALRAGEIVAVKGVGGFQLACDARSSAAVQRLRDRKRREAKPLALLAASVEGVIEHAAVSPAERAVLETAARPIVLLSRLTSSDLAPEIAPSLRELGFMLPASPLHQLLAEGFGGPLVVTSGNVSDEPIAKDDDEARRRLGAIADAFLVHDRAIVARLDDSVARVERGTPRLLRRARGYVPGAVPLPSRLSILAVGADLKSTFCIAAGGIAQVSQHIGGLESPEARAAWLSALATWSALLAFEPEIAACDLHPDYASTRFAVSLGVPLVRVQHHHAHVAACLAEHGQAGPVVGVVFDGAGFGDDGAVWGGEILVADLQRATRAAHLRNVRMPGGDAASRAPWRMALAYLDDAGEPVKGCGAPAGHDLEPLLRAARRGVASPWTSSAGRLFDAVAAMLGIRGEARYEGQAAMELEAASGAEGAPYPFRIEGREPATIDLRPMAQAIARDVREGRSIAEMGARFHATLAAAVIEVAASIARERGIKTVVLSGGCFQNARLAAACERGLEQRGLAVLRPCRFPPNDGGISLGQAAVAAARTMG